MLVFWTLGVVCSICVMLNVRMTRMRHSLDNDLWQYPLHKFSTDFTSDCPRASVPILHRTACLHLY